MSWIYIIVHVFTLCKLFEYFAGKRRRVETRSLTISLARKVLELEKMPLPPRPPKKVFKPKLPNLPVLKNYGVPAGKDYWKEFPSKRNLHSRSPYKLRSDRLLELAVEANVPDMDTVMAVIDQINNGCDLRVDVSKYVPSRTANAPSVKQNGRLVADALGTWVKDGIAAGPFESCPATATVCSLQTRPKPNGSERIIVNSSSPRQGFFLTFWACLE